MTPGASGNRIDGVETDAAATERLRIKLSAPPVDGKANKALVAFLAKRWRLPKSTVAITSGATSRTKILTIRGDAGSLAATIEADL